LRDRVGTPELVPKKVICTEEALKPYQEITFLPYGTQQSFRTVLVMASREESSGTGGIEDRCLRHSTIPLVTFSTRWGTLVASSSSKEKLQLVLT
jgi:hypothetical protein